MTFKRKQTDSAPFYDLGEITLNDAAKHFSAENSPALKMIATGEFEQFLWSHENVELYYEKAESISNDDQPDQLDILIRLVGDPIE